MTTETKIKPTLDFAGILAISPDRKRVIIVQRKPDSENYGLPCGGIEEGEDSLTAALREFKEETGLDSRDLFDLNLSIVLRSNPHISDSKIGQTFFMEYQGNLSIFPFIGPEATKVDLMEMGDYLDLCAYRSHDEYVMRNFGLIKS